MDRRKGPKLTMVDTNRSAVSDVLEDYRLQKQWTYRDIVEAIKEQFGYNLAESTVRFCCQGRAGNRGYRHRGIRAIKGRPSTLHLVAAVLNVPEKKLARAYANDLLEQGMSAMDIQAHMGYFTLMYSDLLKFILAPSLASANAALNALNRRSPLTSISA